jgi:hypothetical protein
MHLVTGASDNHYKSLINMILSFMKYHKNDSNYVIVVYNLGIEQSLWERLLSIFNRYTNFVSEVFDYSLYPDYVNININAGEYAWKPIAIYDVFNKYKDITLWMDAGNILINRLDRINNIITQNNLYSGYSGNKDSTILRWTHPKTIEYMGNICEGHDITVCQCRNGACVGFNYNTDYVRTFVEEYRNYALIKECIAPEGSSRANHRQDQSVFSIMFYKYYIMHQFDFSTDADKYYQDYKIQNDVD